MVELDGVCNIHVRDETLIQNFGWKIWQQDILEKYFMFFVPCIAIQLCNVNQQNAL
jgi:hypothetical protein